MSVNREELKRERQVLDHIQQASITSMDFWDNPNYKTGDMLLTLFP